jgi:transcriptional regulator with XRE-family HTH domain
MRRALREEHGNLLSEIAEMFGVTEATVSRWESGERNPGPKHLERYVMLLDSWARD